MNSNKRRVIFDDEPEAKRFKPPVNGSRPTVIMYLLRDDGKAIPVRTLVDTGASCFTVSDRIVNKYKIPTVRRKKPVQVTNFQGVSVSSAGEEYTFPLLLRHKEHYDRQTFEVSPMEPSCDVVLPWWYLTKHRPSGLWESELEFNSEYCRLNCTKHKSEEFDIEYDASVLSTDYDPDEVGVIGMVHFDSNGKAEVDWAALVPKDYQQYRKIFSPEAAAEFPPHRSFDHAIDLKEGEQPPWGPIYALSAKELTALKEYLNKMLATGKIRPSKSPAGAPILFVPKAHGRGLRLSVD